MMDVHNDNSRGRGVTLWIVGGAVAVIILLLLMKCNGCQGGDRGEANAPAALKQTATHQTDGRSSSTNADKSADRFADADKSSHQPLEKDVQHTKAAPKSPQQSVTNDSKAIHQPKKSRIASLAGTYQQKEKQTAEKGTSQEKVEEKAEETTANPTVTNPTVTNPTAANQEVDNPEVTEEIYIGHAPEPVRTETGDTVQVPATGLSSVTEPASSAERPVNTDSLREALSDSIRRALLAELQPQKESPQYNGIALRTNLLYDAALIPTIGAEFDLGKLWSIGFDYNGTWFYSISRHRYWQTIGGYLMLRRYLKADDEGRPFMGHHFGVYGQLLTFDIEFGDKGWQGAYPNWGGGIEYGYSAWLSNRLNIDFSIGLGYLRLKYKEYDPDGESFKWRGTYRRNWWGPTKAEISLKWLLYKRKKHQKANQK